METTADIEKHFINPDLLRQFIEQLQKDFYFSEPVQSLDIHSLKPEEVFPMVCKEVRRLMDKDFGALQNTLYKIDISEQQLKKEFEKPGQEGDEAEVLAQLIMKRELQKIVYRNYFKTKPHED
ncbi:MAG: hypothetical protein K0S33_3015 [Bacteroidetes bacterium]|jgi:hypothetical protein|nr:hypothetical protein [Bacteroidota bacterium]